MMFSLAYAVKFEIFMASLNIQTFNNLASIKSKTIFNSSFSPFENEYTKNVNNSQSDECDQNWQSQRNEKDA